MLTLLAKSFKTQLLGKNRANSCLAGIPNIPSFFKAAFIKQNSTQERRIKIRIHKLKPVCARVFVCSPPINSRFGLFRFFRWIYVFWSNNTPSRCFFSEPVQKSWPFSSLYPRDIGSVNLRLRSFNSCDFHRKSSSKGKIENYREAA